MALKVFIKAQQHSGTLVCLGLSAEQRRKLESLTLGPVPDDAHVTLGYYLQPLELSDLKQWVKLFAASQAPLKGKVNGYGRFKGEGKDPLYLNVDVPALPEFRQNLINTLKTLCGITPDMSHGYTPHITIAYLDKDMGAAAEKVMQPKTVSLEFETVEVWRGGKHYPFKLGA